MNQDTVSKEHLVEKAYTKIIAELIALHKTFEKPHFRKFIQVEVDIHQAHQFISPVIDITLSADKQKIFFGKSLNAAYELESKVFNEITRIIFRNTAKENTEHDIEDCLGEELYHYSEYQRAYNNPYSKINLEG